MPPAPQSIDSYETVVNAESAGWKRFLLQDMESYEQSIAIEGISGGGGGHCAIDSANQPGSSLLFRWLHGILRMDPPLKR